MGLLWGKGATKYQKIVTGILLAITIGPIFLIFTHNFVAAYNVTRFGLYASIALTVVTIVALGFLYVDGLWSPAPVWHKYSKLKKLLVLSFMPVVIFGLIWINMAISMPQLVTKIFGNKIVKEDIVIKDRYHSRRSCDYRLKPRSINTIFFHYCISESLYNRLPAGEMEAELILKKSELGYIVEDIRLFRDKGSEPFN